MANIMLIGLGPHSKRIYMNYFKKHNIEPKLLVDIESNKEIIEDYLLEKKFLNTKIWLLPDEYKNNEELPNQYYNKLLEIDNIEPMNEYYYTADEMHTFVTNMKTNWEEYYKVQCENHSKAIRAAYNGGTLAGPVSASYAMERQKEWAIQLINLYEHF